MKKTRCEIFELKDEKLGKFFITFITHKNVFHDNKDVTLKVEIKTNCDQIFSLERTNH